MDTIDRLELEKNLWSRNVKRVMGLDEAGRGCLAGPVVAAGVILRPRSLSGTDHELDYSRLRDSKTIPADEREELAEQIRRGALFWTVQLSEPAEIDTLNILHASIQAMVRCAEGEGRPDFLLVDGNRYTDSLDRKSALPVLDYSRLRDSKTIPADEREELAEQIRRGALFWTVQLSEPAEIDTLNILHASIQAMVRCAEGEGRPDFLLVDGNRYTDSLIPYECIIGGDDLSASIAAASILAKTWRDRLMKELHNDYPWYGWDTNVGYPTKAHFKGLQKHGYTPHHRRSFRLRTEIPCRLDAIKRTG